VTDFAVGVVGATAAFAADGLSAVLGLESAFGMVLYFQAVMGASCFSSLALF
jgi:hypothetical protein